MSEPMSSLQGREIGSTADNIVAARRTTRTISLPADYGAAARALQLTLPSAELCERLHAAVENAAARDAESMEALRQSVCAFTAALRDAGKSPEVVLITLKALIAAGSLPPLARNHRDWAGHMMRERMSTWCIEHYFSEPARAVTTSLP